MGQTSFRLVLILGLLGLFAMPIHAASVTISELIEQASIHDQTSVTLEGEAILEALERGDHVWVNVNDGTGALGLWMEADLVEAITRYGNYSTTGDWIRVQGTFNRACDEHGGDMDIHVTTLTVIKSGQIIDRPVNVWRFTAALILGMCALATLVFHRHLLLGWLDKSRPNINE